MLWTKSPRKLIPGGVISCVLCIIMMFILTLLANSAEILCVVTVRAVKHKCISTGQKQTNKYEIVSAHGSTNTRGKRY